MTDALTNLTDRMRTCAAYLSVLDPSDWSDEVKDVMCDAAKLLVDAAHEIDVLTGPVDLGEPMEVIPPAVVPLTKKEDWTLNTQGTWTAPGDTLPGLKHSGTISRRTCPKCDSRAHKTARRVGDSLMLQCPVCGHQWTWRKG